MRGGLQIPTRNLHPGLWTTPTNKADFVFVGGESTVTAQSCVNFNFTCLRRRDDVAHTRSSEPSIVSQTHPKRALALSLPEAQKLLSGDTEVVKMLTRNVTMLNVTSAQKRTACCCHR